MVTAATKLENSYDKPRQCIKKQRYHFADKGLYSQSYYFCRGHVWMWELDYQEGWAPKNWCFPAVVLQKTWESLGLQDQTSPSWRISVLNIHWKDWCWSWNSNTLTTWCEEWTHWKRPWFWERLKAKEGAAEDEIVRKHHQLNRDEFEKIWGDSGGQRSLVCCSL